MNIADYVETQLERYENVKFNMVDSLVLSQFVYLNFNGIVPELPDCGDPVRIGDLLKAELIPQMLKDVWNPKSNRRLLIALGMSPRFRDIRLSCYSDSISIVEEKQFAAVTYLLDDKTAYIAYRGTDFSIAGWKENFNMAFISPVPAQQEGVSYLNMVAERFPQHALMIGGHSKGGNVAVYSAMECNPQVQERIIGVYSHDGPGFKDEIFTSEKYARIKERIHKTLPQSSLIGMLLQHHEDYIVVESKQFWLMQHDPFSWIVSNGDFRYKEGITGGAKHIDNAINHWIASLDDKKRELFVTTIYSVIESMGVEKITDFNADWHKKAMKAMRTLRGIDAETKRFVLETIKSLIALYMKSFKFPIKVK